MAEQTSIAHLSEAEKFVVFENVIEYISDVATLASLTLVSKRVKNVVNRSNGLRLLIFGRSFRGWELNEVAIKTENQEENLKDGLRWLWTLGKRLKTVCLNPDHDVSLFCGGVLPLLNSLATTEKRRIEFIRICGSPCEMALDLVRENRNTLRCLRVELWKVSSLRSFHKTMKHFSLSELPESQSFWSVVQQCKHLESLDLILTAPDSMPAELCNVFCGMPLKYLSFHGVLENSGVLQKFIEVLSCDNLRNNLESLRLYNDIYVFHMLLGRLAGEVISPRLSAAFMNVKMLTFEFVAFCCRQTSINWSVFWTVFPALNEMKDNSSIYFVRNTPDITILSQNVSCLCKTYLEVSESHSRKMKIEIQGWYGRTEKLITALVTAATLPEDQDWCTSHGVQIETKTRDEKVERVTLHNDTSTLVFDLK